MGYTTFMIRSFAHCSKCLEEMPENLDPQSFSWIECGINYDKKFQVNCVRHDKVLLIFEEWLFFHFLQSHQAFLFWRL